MYGTAWKELHTEALTLQAINCGYRAIDTANQRKHYVETAVGAALTAAVATSIATRESLFLQTKFTYLAGQDHGCHTMPMPTSTLKCTNRLRAHFAISV